MKLRPLLLLFGVPALLPSVGRAEPFTWGYNNYTQLGLGHTTSLPLQNPIAPSEALRGKSVVAGRTGSYTTLLQTGDGRLFGFGFNAYGQLGNGFLTSQSGVVAMNLSPLGGRTIQTYECGFTHTLVLTADGLVYATGSGYSGQLGDGTSADRSALGPVSTSGALAGLTVSAIACGAEFSLALTADGRLFAWGKNNKGQLGDGTFLNRSTPVAVVQTGVLAGKTVKAISAGSQHSMALTSDGQVFTWGENTAGQLGDGTTTGSSEPVAVSTGGALAGISIAAIAGGHSHSLALDNTGRAYSWGQNSYGQLGTGGTGFSSSPSAVSTSGVLNGKVITAISAGAVQSLAMTAAGEVFGWGLNLDYQISQGTQSGFPTPQVITLPGLLAGRKVMSISAGFGHGLLLTVPQEISVEQPAGTVLDDEDSTANFGSAAAGTSVTRTFVVRNIGGDLLNPANITIDGTHAAEFVVTSAPERIVNGGGATRFTVQFTPVGSGTRSAELHLQNNDSDESLFDISLTGTRP